jgi:uncharacterized MAPEG superfamily protein
VSHRICCSCSTETDAEEELLKLSGLELRQQLGMLNFFRAFIALLMAHRQMLTTGFTSSLLPARRSPAGLVICSYDTSTPPFPTLLAFPLLLHLDLDIVHGCVLLYFAIFLTTESSGCTQGLRRWRRSPRPMTSRATKGMRKLERRTRPETPVPAFAMGTLLQQAIQLPWPVPFR